jgi:hypothetical protein
MVNVLSIRGRRLFPRGRALMLGNGEHLHTPRALPPRLCLALVAPSPCRSEQLGPCGRRLVVVVEPRLGGLDRLAAVPYGPIRCCLLLRVLCNTRACHRIVLVDSDSDQYSWCTYCGEWERLSNLSETRWNIQRGNSELNSWAVSISETKNKGQYGYRLKFRRQNQWKLNQTVNLRE